MKKSEELLIGAHTSIAGGVYKALLQGKEIGATTIQLFTSNQRQWKGHHLTSEEIDLWNATLKETGLKELMSHASYLINLGSHNGELLHKSQEAFKEELVRCHKLDIAFLNFHPGSATGWTEEECLNQIVASLKKFEPLCEKGKTRLLLETTAGQGSSIGHRFEHLAYILEHVDKKIPIGVCIDTCHLFSAGYDLRSKEAWEETLKEFDRIIGIKKLYAFHLNDSLKPFAARKDRHAHLGEGLIGLECFKFVMAHPKLREIPKYLETPRGLVDWKREIQLLREFSNEEHTVFATH
ncbi:MAG TPA: deoxyribonuclease IV [Rhabdochlamydiaceae bacterium]|nr:deoxyribonuclease IV [Rhabdochlamydiaceae bacterium]